MRIIDEFRGDYFFLSNFYSKEPFMHNGIMFSHAEAAFMHSKNLTPEYQHSILRAESPREARRLGRACELRADWEQIKGRVLFDVLWDKFYPGTKMSYRLLATGEATLIEGTNGWLDQEYGCTYKDVISSSDDDGYEVRNTYRRVYTGKNKLGHILMAIRQLQK